LALFQLKGSSNEGTEFERVRFSEKGCGCSKYKLELAIDPTCYKVDSDLSTNQVILQYVGAVMFPSRSTTAALEKRNIIVLMIPIAEHLSPDSPIDQAASSVWQ
jgi:hypothetical protein